MNSGRAYRMTARADAMEERRRRAVEAARELLVDQGTFTLADVADRAGTSVQTLMRAFGSKENLIVAAIGTSRDENNRGARRERPASPEEAVRQVFDDYEEIGDRVVRMLEEEQRVPDLAAVCERGRGFHREWATTAFAVQLRRHRGRARDEVVDALVAATDVYMWKLLRRDLGMDRARAQAVVLRLVRGVL